MPKTGGFDIQKTQIRSTSARKHKLKVHQPQVMAAEPVIQSEDEEEPEIEYCPPKITPMLDLPEIGFSPNHKFPVIGGLDHLAAAYEEALDRHDPIGSDGLRKSVREAQRKQKEWNDYDDRMLEEAARQSCTLTDADLEFWGVKPVQRRDLTAKPTSRPDHSRASARAPSTTTSRNTTTMPSSKGPPSFAAPTAAAKARKAAVLSTTPASRPQTTGEAASRTTVGYSAGRKVSSEMRQHRSAGPRMIRKLSEPIVTLDDIVKEFNLKQDRKDCEDDDGFPFRRVDANDIIIPGLDDIENFRLEL